MHISFHTFDGFVIIITFYCSYQSIKMFNPYLDKVYDPLIAGSIDGTDTEPHDRAISRAMNVRYRPSKLLKSDPHKTLFVAQLSPRTQERTLYETFEEFGKINQLHLIRDIVTGYSKCYAFIEFERENDMLYAYSKADKLAVDDKEISVDYEHERTLKNWVPRRLGGGFGGKKESGQLRFGGRDRPFRRPFYCSSQPQLDAGYHQMDYYDRYMSSSSEHRSSDRHRDRDSDRHEYRNRHTSRSSHN